MQLKCTFKDNIYSRKTVITFSRVAELSYFNYDQQSVPSRKIIYSLFSRKTVITSPRVSKLSYF